MIPKSGHRFSEKITHKQGQCVIPKSGHRFAEKITHRKKSRIDKKRERGDDSTKNHPTLVAGDLSVTDVTAEQLRAAGVAKGGGPGLAVPRGLEHCEAEAVVGTAIRHPAARDRLAAEIVLDLAGEQRAAGAEHELRAALVREAQDLHHMDMAGERERDAVGQLAVPVRQRLLQGGVDGAAPRTESPDRAVGEQQVPDLGFIAANSAA